jgi:Zn-dependent metalloprotease
MIKRICLGAILLACGLMAVTTGMGAQQLSLAVLRPTSDAELRSVSARVAQMERSGQLRLRSSERDPAFPNRLTERLQQYHQGVPVFGADVVRDSEQGVARTILGTVVPDFDLSVSPTLSENQANAAVRRIAGDAGSVVLRPELVILPLSSGPRLAYMAVLSTADDVFRLFVDAGDGAELVRFTEVQTQAAVGQGRGVLGDQKKLSVFQQSGAFVRTTSTGRRS